MLDGSAVQIGDHVYDIILGPCTVIAVSKDGGFTIRARSTTINILRDGYLGRSKRVYWKNPVPVIPRRGDKAFDMATDVMKDLYHRLNNNTWGFNEVLEEDKED